MTLPAWPSALPLPVEGSLAVSLADLAVRSTIATGSQQARQRFTRQAATVPFTLTMTDVQLAIFEAWFSQTIAGGSSWFTISIPSETGTSSHTARLSSGYSVTLTGLGMWSVSASLTIDDPPKGA